MAELITDSPYARRRGLRGFEAVLTVMEAYKAMLDDLRSRSQLPTVVLEGCAGHWDFCHQQILAFLQL